MNSKLRVAFLSHSDAATPPPPNNTTTHPLSFFYLSLFPFSFFLFLLQCHSAIVFTLKRRLGALEAGRSVGLNSAAVRKMTLLKPLVEAKVILTEV